MLWEQKGSSWRNKRSRMGWLVPLAAILVAFFVLVLAPLSVLADPVNSETQTTQTDDQTTNQQARRNCNIPWIGWAICPIINGLAEFVDGAYDTVSEFVKTPAISPDSHDQLGQERPIYAVWSAVRNISNLVFIIVFMVVIFSHLTGFGLSNYHIKKIFPKLLVAAVLVNLSLYACSLAIDLSNIIGYSIGEFFTNVLNRTLPNSFVSNYSWVQIVSTVLGGGVLAGGVTLALVGGPVVAGITILIGLVSALIVVASILIMLTARQAIVIILIALAPLAIVASILPNTEDLFTKWWKMLGKLLLLFPTFAIIYGGSKLASGLVLQTAGDSFLLILMGLLLRIVPFVMLFSLIKNSNEILKTIGDKIHQGLGGSVGKKATDYLASERDIRRARYLAKQSPNYDNKLRNALSKTRPRSLAQELERRRRRRETRLRGAQADLDASYQSRLADMSSKRLNRDARVEKQARAAEARLAGHKQAAESAWQRVTAQSTENYQKLLSGDATIKMERFDIQIAQEALRKKVADARITMDIDTEKSYFNKMLVDNPDAPVNLGYQDATAGIGLREVMASTKIDEYGADTILSQALGQARKEAQDARRVRQEFIKQVNLSEQEKMAYLEYDHHKVTTDPREAERYRKLGFVDGKITKTLANGEQFVLDVNDDLMRSAVFEMIAAIPRTDMHQILDNLTVDGGPLAKQIYRELASEGVYGSGVNKSNMLLGIKTPDYIAQGWYRGDDSLHEMLMENIAKGRYSAEKIATQDKDIMDVMIAGLEKVIGNQSIQLVKPGEDGSVQSQQIIRTLISKADNDKQKAISRSTAFRDDLQRSLDDEQISRTMTKDQRDKVKDMVQQMDQVLGQLQSFTD